MTAAAPHSLEPLLAECRKVIVGQSLHGLVKPASAGVGLEINSAAG